MENKFQDVLNSISAKTGRSRLEPYGELVDELRRQGLTCRDIAAVLSQTCQFQTLKSAGNNFVRARARKRRNTSRQISAARGCRLRLLPNLRLCIPGTERVTKKSGRESPR